MKPNGDLQVDLGQILAQSEENSKQIAQLRKDFTDAFRQLSSTIEMVNTRTIERAAPSLANMAAWATVVLMLVGIVGTGLFFYINKRFELGEVSRVENFNQFNTRIERVENIQDDNAKDEMKRYRDLLDEKLRKD